MQVEVLVELGGIKNGFWSIQLKVFGGFRIIIKKWLYNKICLYFILVNRDEVMINFQF